MQEAGGTPHCTCLPFLMIIDNWKREKKPEVAQGWGLLLQAARQAACRFPGIQEFRRGGKKVGQILLIMPLCKYFSVTQLQGSFTQLWAVEEYRQKRRKFGSNESQDFNEKTKQPAGTQSHFSHLSLGEGFIRDCLLAWRESTGSKSCLRQLQLFTERFCLSIRQICLDYRWKSSLRMG